MVRIFNEMTPLTLGWLTPGEGIDHDNIPPVFASGE
jgi:hypothetical protein